MLEEGYKLFDYNVNMNDVIQLMVNKKMEIDTESQSEESMDEEKIEEEPKNNEKLAEATSAFYRVGDKVDCQDKEYGGWFEAEIHKIFKRSDVLVYSVKWEFSEDEEPFDVEENIIRPRAYKRLSFEQLKVGDKIMVNYNIDEPDKNGFWYDFTIVEIKKNRTTEKLVGNIHIGK